MSYIAGQFWNFSNRLHQLPTTLSDLDSFITEGDSYLTAGYFSLNASGKLEKEIRKRKYCITSSGESLLNPLFGQIALTGNYISWVPSNITIDIVSLTGDGSPLQDGPFTIEQFQQFSVNSIDEMEFNIDGPSLTSVSNISILPNLLNFTIDHASSLTSLPTWPTNLEFLDLNGLTLTSLNTLPTGLSTLHLENSSVTSLSTFPSTLTTLHAAGCPLSTLGSLTQCVGIIEIQLTSCSLNQSKVDAVLSALATNAQNDGTLDIDSNVAPSAAGILNKNILISRGWTVTTD